MADLTPERLQELRRIAEAAVPGKWSGQDFQLAMTPRTALALLDEIERLRRERDVLAEALKHVWTCENCECATCLEGTGLSLRAYRALGGAMDLLDGEKGGGGE